MKANAQFNPYYMKRCIRPVLKIHKAYRSYNEKKTTNQKQKKPKNKTKKTPKTQTKTNNNPQKNPNQKKNQKKSF